MGNRKIRRYTIATLLALGAGLLGFGVAYAAIAQWARVQGAVLNIEAAQVLAPESMTLCEDAQCQNELTADENIQITVTRLQPPLDRFLLQRTSGSRKIWAQNNSDIPLNLLPICCPDIRDPETGEFLAQWRVEPECTRRIILPPGASGVSPTPTPFPAPPFPPPPPIICGLVEPGDTSGISIHVLNIQPAAFNMGAFDFSVVIGAIGETTGVTGSAVVQDILEQLEAEQESQQNGLEN